MTSQRSDVRRQPWRLDLAHLEQLGPSTGSRADDAADIITNFLFSQTGWRYVLGFIKARSSPQC